MLLARLPFLQDWRLVTEKEGIQIHGERNPDKDSSNRESKNRSNPEDSQNPPGDQHCDDCRMLAVRECYPNTALTVRAVRGTRNTRWPSDSRGIKIGKTNWALICQGPTPISILLALSLIMTQYTGPLNSDERAHRKLSHYRFVLITQCPIHMRRGLGGRESLAQLDR